MGLHSRYARGQLVYWEDHRHRIVGGVGADFQTIYESDFHDSEFQAAGGTATDPTGWTTTVVEVGAGTSEAAKLDSDDGIVRLLTAANENDGISLQRVDETIGLSANKDIYVGLKIDAADEATQLDFLFGLCITDTALLGGMTDGIYFEKLDGGTGISSVTEKDSSEEQNDSLGTFAVTGHILEIYISGVTAVYFYIDGVRVATHETTLPDDELLSLSLELLTGEAVAHNVDLDWLRCYAIGRG